jgi:hypothetical protein
MLGMILLEMQNFRYWNFTQLILDKINASLIVDDFKDVAENWLRTFCNRRGGWDV